MMETNNPTNMPQAALAIAADSTSAERNPATGIRRPPQALELQGGMV